MKRFIHCPVCPRSHEIIEITVECNKSGDAQHIAHVYCDCDALGKAVTARRELARRDDR
jgi:phosphoribosyl-AMP cyclohydrolase